MSTRKFILLAITDLGLNLITLTMLGVMFVVLAFWHPNNLERSHG